MLEFFSSENWGSEKPYRFWQVFLKIEKDLHKSPPQCHIFSINVIFTIQHEYSSTLSKKNDLVYSAYKHCNINKVEINLILKIRPSEHSY